MATKQSSGLSLSSNYYLRTYYQSNTDLTKAASRKKYSAYELGYEDSRALRRAAVKVSKMDYTDNPNQESIANSVMAYVDTFNNTLSSAAKDSDTRRYASQLKALAKKYADDFSEVGIEVNANGTLKANNNLLKTADLDKLKEIFSKESDFKKAVTSTSQKMHQTSNRSIYTHLTGTGARINIVL